MWTTGPLSGETSSSSDKAAHSAASSLPPPLFTRFLLLSELKLPPLCPFGMLTGHAVLRPAKKIRIQMGAFQDRSSSLEISAIQLPCKVKKKRTVQTHYYCMRIIMCGVSVPSINQARCHFFFQRNHCSRCHNGRECSIVYLNGALLFQVAVGCC